MQTECEKWIFVAKLMIDELTGETKSPDASAAPAASHVQQIQPSEDSNEKVLIF